MPWHPFLLLSLKEQIHKFLLAHFENLCIDNFSTFIISSSVIAFTCEKSRNELTGFTRDPACRTFHLALIVKLYGQDVLQYDCIVACLKVKSITAVTLDCSQIILLIQLLLAFVHFQN